MKKLVLFFGLVGCLTFGQQKVDIHKYYTNEQIQLIKKEVKEYLFFYGDKFAPDQLFTLLDVVNGNPDRFKDDKQKEVYLQYFVYPYFDKFHLNHEPQFYQVHLTRLLQGIY